MMEPAAGDQAPAADAATPKVIEMHPDSEHRRSHHVVPDHQKHISASGLNVLQGTVLQGDGPPRRLFEMSIALWKMPSKHSDFH